MATVERQLGAIEEIVARQFSFQSTARPTPQVLVRWRGVVYGVFRVGSELLNANPPLYSLTFETHSADFSVFQVSTSEFSSLAQKYTFVLEAEFALTGDRRSQHAPTVRTRREIVLPDGLGILNTADIPRLILEPLERKLMGLAKQYLTRRKRQEFRGLLEELETEMAASPASAEDLQALSSAKALSDEQDRALTDLAQAMVRSGILGEERIREAENRVAERYIEMRSAELQAEVTERIREKKTALEEVEGSLMSLEAKLAAETVAARQRLEGELEMIRAQAEGELLQQRERIKAEEEELDRQREVIQENLREVTDELRDAGDKVVNRFLTLAPLLGGLGLPLGAVSAESLTDTRKSGAPDKGVSEFSVPGILLTRDAGTISDIPEEEFFDRFLQVVTDSGFTYREIDLKRFHVSLKSGPLTVLGGPSGTGKSSLPLLYTAALLGEENLTREHGSLMVSVNPSWMETRDLMGHFNSLEGRFYPAETGLYQFLIFAQEEHAARGRASGIYLTCLDEMNLSQVEHYFSDFLSVFERVGRNRSISCFPAEVASDRCPFKRWASVTLSPALRFVGTVNFDETTRLLSDRVLDRVNLINLGATAFPEAGSTRTREVVEVKGRRIMLGDLERWVVDTALPKDLASLLDTMRPILNRLGCPISPRTYRAIRIFVGSAPPLLTPPAAFDLQLAQRVVPRIRPPTSRAGSDRLDDLLKLLSDSKVCQFEEALPLLQELREDEHYGSWEFED